MSTPVRQFQYVEEDHEPFLSLFPHRFDYIYAEHPQAGQKPNWKTESRHPLSDRLFNQGGYLYGVRFGQQTRYCLIDIDIQSLYHPRQDAFGIAKIVAALEPLGLVSYIPCRSSYSGGLHLYFPFSEALRSWELASAVTTLLEQAGFRIAPGQLEVFPNLKPYVAEGHPSLFNAHRLPLQVGFSLLNQELQPIWSDRSVFVNQWQFASNRNDISATLLQRILKQLKQKPYRISHKAEKFLNDLNAEIELGWTGVGQTNRLLGRIAMRSYIFHPLISGGVALAGQSLIDEIVSVACSLPGYQEWCQHQHEIEQRAAEWARCIEGSRYFPYAVASKNSSKNKLLSIKPSGSSSSEPTALTWNQKQSQLTREKITRSIATLLETNTLPAGTTARFQALTRFGISGSSLYRHRDLWHPEYLAAGSFVENDAVTSCPVENPHAPTSLEHDSLDSNELPSNGHCSTSLFPSIDCNTAQQANFNSSTILDRPSAGCNANWYQSNPIQKMQQFLASGDPILMAEAKRWFDQRSSAQPKSQNPLELETLEAKSLPLPSNPSSQSLPYDHSDLLALIAIHIRQLGWTQQLVRDRLQQQFGKPKQSLLSDQELNQWLTCLKQQLLWEPSKYFPGI